MSKERSSSRPRFRAQEAIEGLRIISGPPMLQQAAIDAIRAARYRPYRLNDVPTAVQTTISINFRLGS